MSDEPRTPQVVELVAAAQAWDAARIPRTSSSTLRAADRLSAAVRALATATVRTDTAPAAAP
jgi:hypothetical protein